MNNRAGRPDARRMEAHQYMDINGDVWRGWTYWAAGPFWDKTITLEPRNGQDARQIAILQPYLPRPASL